jgi:hypothetical protein
MQISIDFHGTVIHISAWIIFIVVAIVGAFLGRAQRPGVESRNSGSLYVFGGVLGACLVGIAYLYPSFWAIIPACVAVACVFGLRADM